MSNEAINHDTYSWDETSLRITNPGKFEGEPRYLPFFWDNVEFAKNISFPDAEYYYLWIGPDDTTTYPELAPYQGEAVVMQETEQGFVICAIKTQTEINALSDRADLEWHEFEIEDND